MTMLLEYDPDADAVYVRLQEPHGLVRGARVDERRTVCYDEQKQVVGVEFLFVSQGIDVEGMPEAERIREMVNRFPHTAA